VSKPGKFPFMQVDAFTDSALGGNPCAIVFDADDLDNDLRQRIAREMNLSETAYVQRSASADIGARYFTPATEIPLAGHPTIATVFALFETGRPVLVAAAQTPSSIGERVVVAWNGSTETARCIALSMPFLERADAVLVLTVEGWQVPGPSGDQVTAHLRRNGISATAKHVDSGSRSVGEAILDETKEFNADLIVKGAYTHSRLRQLVFGGATRHLLHNTPIPLFMAH